MEFIASPNFNDRKSPIDMLILHYTETRDAAEALGILTSEEHHVSAHYLIDIDGTIIQMVQDDKRAWHAGQSYWQGVSDINSCSIGIEIQNTGHAGSCPPYPTVQIQSVISLCQDLMSRHSISPARVLAHSDIAPARKKDPGEHFPWQPLAEHGIGLWPTQNHDKETIQSLDALLLDIGYDPAVTADERAIAFYRRFDPQSLNAPDLNRSTCIAANLLALI